MNILYSLQHLDYTIPPQADAGWIGPTGPGPSYLDAGSGGPRQRLHGGVSLAESCLMVSAFEGNRAMPGSSRGITTAAK